MSTALDHVRYFCGGAGEEVANRVDELEAENARLRRAVADLTLDKLILKEAASGNW